MRGADSPPDRETRFATWVVLLGVAAALSLFGSTDRGAASSRARVQIERVTLRPRIVAPYAWANIKVTGLADASAVDVRLTGASGIRGTLLSWLPLRRDGSTWAGRLPQPVLAGIYPIDLRARPARPVQRKGAEYLRIYWAGTTARPLFSSPEQAVEWWVRHVGGTLVAVRQWPGSAIDHRLVRLHRLFVVAYQPRNSQSAKDRLGAWVTTVREGEDGNWRVLEVGDVPP